MSFSTFHTFHATPSFACAFRSKPSLKTTPTPTPPARDRVIDFGKHKGKMLGSLPSSYLKWVSKNLRARDFEEWAVLADQILQDPFYQDRIQWEFAENILNGNSKRPAISSSSSSIGVVSELVEISERFGWDNEDKSGWRNINFELLGTSKGGRIPRINRDVLKEKSKSETETDTDNVSEEDGGRRRERRDRQMLKRERQMLKKGDANVSSERNEKGGGTGNMLDVERRRNPFPGRESLLQNVVNRIRK